MFIEWFTLLVGIYLSFSYNQSFGAALFLAAPAPTLKK